MSRTSDLNKRIQKNEKQLSDLGTLMKTLEAMAPMVELAIKYSIKTDSDKGNNKSALRTVLADVLTIKAQVAEEYSDVADVIYADEEELKQLKN